jgi:hypothetical protein
MNRMPTESKAPVIKIEPASKIVTLPISFVMRMIVIRGTATSGFIRMTVRTGVLGERRRSISNILAAGSRPTRFMRVRKSLLPANPAGTSKKMKAHRN